MAPPAAHATTGAISVDFYNSNYQLISTKTIIEVNESGCESVPAPSNMFYARPT